MKQLKNLMEFEDMASDFEFETRVLEKNNKEAELLNKKGYRIKKSVWKGLIAS